MFQILLNIFLSIFLAIATISLSQPLRFVTVPSTTVNFINIFDFRTLTFFNVNDFDSNDLIQHPDLQVSFTS